MKINPFIVEYIVTPALISIKTTYFDAEVGSVPPFLKEGRDFFLKICIHIMEDTV